MDLKKIQEALRKLFEDLKKKKEEEEKNQEKQS